MNLRTRLLAEGRSRWLDIGCGGSRDDGFTLLDTFPENLLDAAIRSRYVRADVLNLSDTECQRLGQFDLVRLQHTLEHFSLEEGLTVLKNCAKLLSPGGSLLITVPDLRVHVRRYLSGRYADWPYFDEWAHKRIPPGSPSSFYFGVFAYSLPYESHKWSYDAEGLKYQLARCGCFDEIMELELGHPLSSTPFTHGRPEEDLCVLSVRNILPIAPVSVPSGQ
jgi:SAM-dependent methyltransferase